MNGKISTFTRARNMLTSPASEWRVIARETATPRSLLFSYVVPMALIPAIACFIGYSLFGIDALAIRIGGAFWGFFMGLDSFICSLIVYVSGIYIVNALAPAFHSEKNIGRSAQLAAYSYTAVWVAGIFYLYPPVAKLAIISLYGVYLFYLGTAALKKMPDDQRIPYTIVSAILMIIVRFLTELLISNLFYLITGQSFPSLWYFTG
jgi:Yip1 domain